jgi:hypothetical protein
MLFNQFQIFTGDVVLVLLHLGESLFVVVHQLVDVFIFALLDFVDFHLHSQVELSLQLPQLLFVVFDEAFF